MGTSRIIAYCLLCSLSILCLAQPAYAEEPAAPNARAVQLGYKALDLFKRRQFTAAFEEFQAAETLTHSPVFVLYMARCQRELGNLLTAHTLLASLKGPAPDAAAPEAWKRALKDAAVDLEAIEQIIPNLKLVVRGSATLPLTLRDNERTLLLNELESTLKFEPGAHSLTLSDARGRTLRRELTLRESEQAVVSFEFEAPKTPTTAERDAIVKTGRSPNAVDTGDANKLTASHANWGARAAFGIGAASLVFGGVTGAIALVKANEIKANCVGNSCLASDRAEADSARVYANLASVGFVVGVIGIGTGITLWLSERSPKRVSLRAQVSPSAVSLVGSF